MYWRRGSGTGEKLPGGADWPRLEWQEGHSHQRPGAQRIARAKALRPKTRREASRKCVKERRMNSLKGPQGETPTQGLFQWCGLEMAMEMTPAQTGLGVRR